MKSATALLQGLRAFTKASDDDDTSELRAHIAANATELAAAFNVTPEYLQDRVHTRDDAKLKGAILTAIDDRLADIRLAHAGAKATIREEQLQALAAAAVYDPEWRCLRSRTSTTGRVILNVITLLSDCRPGVNGYLDIDAFGFVQSFSGRKLADIAALKRLDLVCFLDADGLQFRSAGKLRLTLYNLEGSREHAKAAINDRNLQLTINRNSLQKAS